MRIKKIVGRSEHLHIVENKLYFGKASAQDVLREFGSPLYVYQEGILRETCRRVKQMVTYPNYVVNFSAKANSNLALLRIIKEEGLHVDAMSPGEIFLFECAGFRPDEIFFVPNNVAAEEFVFARNKGINTSVDSLDQLKRYGELFPGDTVAIRINPGVGDGHHAKVVTAGEKTKFGIHISQVADVKAIAGGYGLRINGLNMHIGSNFLDHSKYLEAVEILHITGESFDDLEYIDIGGGFGISYDDCEADLNLEKLGNKLDEMFYEFARNYGRQITFAVEPGRYICAECGILLTTVHAVKQNLQRTIIGTDGGFNVLLRPILYDSYHEIINCDRVFGQQQLADICGNICESGDLLACNRLITPVSTGDIFAVMDAGAYGYSMASNYNSRLKPAEVLIDHSGQLRLIRRRDTFEDLVQNQVAL